MPTPILVAGIGNIFKGDDAFGVEVVRLLSPRLSLPGVKIIDFGIRGLDFAYTLLDGPFEAVIIIDLLQRGHPPGTLSLLELQLPEVQSEEVGSLEVHDLDPFKVLTWVSIMENIAGKMERRPTGKKLKSIRLLGCEPEKILEEEEMEMGLSSSLQASLPEAVAMAEKLIQEWAMGEISCMN